jgi:hypothetical protein
MKIFEKVFVPLLVSVLLCATVLPSVSNAEPITKPEVNLVHTEVIQTDRGDATLSTIIAVIGAGTSLNTQSYYTIYQYSYPRKCEAIPYANHTVFYQDASRNKVIGTADSAKFFSSQPYPIGCTP